MGDVRKSLRKIIPALFALCVPLIFSSCRGKAEKDTRKENEFSEESKIDSEDLLEGDDTNVKTSVKTSGDNISLNKTEEKGSFDYIRSLKSKHKYTQAEKNLSMDYLLGTWSVEVISEPLNYVRIAFDDDGTYYVFSPFGGYMGQKGEFKLDGNQLTLFFPNFRSSRWDDLIFPDGKETSLVYDYDFKDFYDVGVLRNENVILRSGVEKNPVGTKSILKGIEVIKTEPTGVVASDNLKIRHEPSQKGNEASFWYPMFLTVALKDLLEDSYYKSDVEQKSSHVILKGTKTSYDAKTVKEDTIDGITSPWYRISLFDMDGESITQYFWVFGGYLEPYDKSKDAEYNQQLFDAAVEKGLLVIDEDAYQDYIWLESIKRVTEIASDSAEKIHKAGNVAENNDVLEGTVFKMGMTKKELVDLLGEPLRTKLDESSVYWVDFIGVLPRGEKDGSVKTAGDLLQYFVDHGGSGFRLIFHFSGDKLVKIETEWEK